MTKILIGLNIHEKLISMQRKCSWRAMLLLLGKNKYGVCTELKVLKKSTQYGCGYMPGISTNELTRGTISLVKRGFSVGGFAYISKSEYSEPHWGGDHGDDIYIHPGVPFLCFTGPRVLAQVSDRHGNIDNLDISVVDKNFGKPVPTKIRKTVVKRTKSIKRGKK